jgi:hypothetical protein
MIFGRRISRHYRGKLQTEIEDMNLPNPVIRSHYGNGFIKQYVRDHLILRTEAASNNVHDYCVNKSVQNLPALRKALSAINDNYLNVQQDILETFVDRGQLRRLAEPTITPTGRRIPGLRLDYPRQLALMHALVRFAHVAAGIVRTTFLVLRHEPVGVNDGGATFTFADVATQRECLTEGGPALSCEPPLNHRSPENKRRRRSGEHPSRFRARKCHSDPNDPKSSLAGAGPSPGRALLRNVRERRPPPAWWHPDCSR